MLTQQWLWTSTVRSKNKYVIGWTPSVTTADEGLTSICEIDWLPFWHPPGYNPSVCFDYFHRFLFVIGPHTTHFPLWSSYKWYLTLIAKQRVHLKRKGVLSFVLSWPLVTNWKTTIPLWSNMVIIIKVIIKSQNQILIAFFSAQGH